MLEHRNLDTEQKCEIVCSVPSLCQTREQKRKEVGHLAKFTPPTDYSDAGFSLVSIRSSVVFCSIADRVNFVCWLPLCPLGTR